MLGSGARLVPGFVMKGDSIAGRYRVDRVLGSGSSGFVVAARHIQSRDKVALKVLTNGAHPDERMLAGARLASPHLARVVDSGFTREGQAFIATEYLEGQSLAQLIAAGPVAPKEAVSMIRQACAGLAVAHAAGVMHGSLKPQNLFLTTDGIVKIVDFGMSLPLVEETDQESSAAWLHSPAYLSPEQLREPTSDARADVWALGVILHELVTGALPFDAETIAGMFVAVAYDEPKPLDDVPAELARAVKACLAKNASQRPSVTELGAMLGPLAPAESMPPQMAMTVSVEDPAEPAEVVEPSPASRMKAAFERSSSRPPPLPSSRLGANPRPRMSTEFGRRFERGWLSARLMAETIAPDARTHAERDFQRRRWGAMGVVAAAAVLAVAGLVASPSTTAAAAAQHVTAEPVEVVETPLSFGLDAFVPPSFALPERERTTISDRAMSPAASLPVRWVPPPRTRLIVREDPYLRPIQAPAPTPKGTIKSGRAVATTVRR